MKNVAIYPEIAAFFVITVYFQNKTLLNQILVFTVMSQEE